MNKHYFDRYLKFIKTIKSRPVSENYTECHHILPRSLGGTDDEDNLIDLTARQHYVAHWLLWRAYNNEPMISAFWFMSHIETRTGVRRVNGRTYEILKADKSRRQEIIGSSVMTKNWKENRDLMVKSLMNSWTDVRKKSVTGNKNPAFDHKIYLFINADGREELCHQSEFKKKYPTLNPGKISEIIRGTRKSHHGWKVSTT